MELTVRYGTGMDFLEFFRIVERERDLLNPISQQKLARVAAWAGVQDGTRVLDVGSGKGAMLRGWAATWAIQGTGVEVNGAFVQEARQRAQTADVAARLTFWQGAALDFTPDPSWYDVTVCLGATFALGGFREALGWLRGATRPGGAVVIGDVHQALPAAADDLAREGWAELPSLADRHAQVRAEGLEVVGFAASSPDDWDEYTSLMWQATHRWAQTDPSHPDRAEVLRVVQEGRERYFRFERAHLGWGVWVLRDPAR
ncbi:SAM-dependent methyltransferase [Deinococcus sp. RM]|uniref:SAM-dependent methyltransferase n=1 Tax=Deinococcus sp. RM TaxID=2316359 RepID=UPI001314A11E|nr:class I SAM-dependent methyltransferase [Deinococcus sp. RM]